MLLQHLFSHRHGAPESSSSPAERCSHFGRPRPASPEDRGCISRKGRAHTGNETPRATRCFDGPSRIRKKLVEGARRSEIQVHQSVKPKVYRPFWARRKCLQGRPEASWFPTCGRWQNPFVEWTMLTSLFSSLVIAGRSRNLISVTISRSRAQSTSGWTTRSMNWWLSFCQGLMRSDSSSRIFHRLCLRKENSLAPLVAKIVSILIPIV